MAFLLFRRKWRFVKFLVFVIVVVVTFYGGYFYGTNKVSVSWKNFRPISKVESMQAPAIENLDMDLLYQTLDSLNKDYYDKTKLDSTKILYGAVSGVLASLDDPYTSFFPPARNEAFKEQLAGEFSGIGAELTLNKDKLISVIAPLEESPAQKAGIKPGDIIIKVEGKETIGWSLADAVAKIRGKKGTPVKLTIIHENEDTPKEVTIVRDTIVVKSVRGWVERLSCEKNMCKRAPKDCTNCPSVAYIRLSQFGDKTNQEWTDEVNKLFPQFSAEKNFKGIILDVRSNPGGYLNDAVYIASEFIEDGLIVAQEDGNGNREELNVNRKGVLGKYPLIVLVDGGSASASEIVSGALKDRKGAKIMGEHSFGKGTVQSAIDVTGGGSIHMTIAKWLTPNGTWVHQKGIEPDIKVSLDASKSATMQSDGGYDNQIDAAIRELIK